MSVCVWIHYHRTQIHYHSVNEILFLCVKLSNSKGNSQRYLEVFHFSGYESRDRNGETTNDLELLASISLLSVCLPITCKVAYASFGREVFSVFMAVN